MGSGTDIKISVLLWPKALSLSGKQKARAKLSKKMGCGWIPPPPVGNRVNFFFLFLELFIMGMKCHITLLLKSLA